MRRWRALLLTGVALVLLLAAASAMFGPGLVRDQARAWVARETGRTLEVGEVSINLLAMTVEIRDVTLTETDRITPFLSWERLYVALSPRSLWHRAPVIRRIQLERPFVRVERLPAGRFNFSTLLERQGDKPMQPAGEGEAVRFSLNNVELHGGRVEIIDRTLATPAMHRINGIELAVPFVGNLPYLEERYVEPLLRATVNGTPFELKGELKPFAETHEYSFRLKLDRIDLPYYLGYLPATLPVTVHAGKLDADLEIGYRASAQSKPLFSLAGRIGFSDLDLRERTGTPLLRLPRLDVRLAPSHPLDRHLDLAAVSIERPQLQLERSAAGEWNVARGGVRKDPATPAVDTGEKSPPLQLTIGQLRLKDGELAFTDRQPAGGFATRLTGISLDVDGFTLAEGKPFTTVLQLASAREERLRVQGQVALAPLNLDLNIDLQGAPLAAYQPYYQAQVAAPIVGRLDAMGRLRLAPEQPLLIEEAALALHDLAFPFSTGEGFRFGTVTLQGGRLDLAANRLEVGELSMRQANLDVARGSDGRWSFLDRNYPLLLKLAEPAGPPKAASGPPFSWRFGKISVTDSRVAFRDALPAEPVQFSLAALDATVSDLAAPGHNPAGLAIKGNIQKKGTFQLQGTVVPSGPELSATVTLRRVPLPPFAPYLADRVRLVLVDGQLDSHLNVTLARRDGNWRGRFGGSLGLSRCYALDADHREDLLRWERLQFNGIDGRLGPFALKVAAIAINDYYARVLIDEQGQLNFAHLAVHKAAESAAPEAVPQPEPADSAVPTPKSEVRIDKITLQGGTVNFTDRHLGRPFSAEMLQLGGRIEGLNSAAATRAEVDLRGRLRNESPLTITGTFNPLADPLALDLAVDFNDIDLSPLSPYAGTYVGYLIERGKLNVALAYRIEDGKLKASNRLFIDQFTFGDKVESARATNLPVKLAVALLKDRNGEIHLDIPVYGDLNDPQFSVWGVIWQVVKNLLVKAATSPLALLGALGGGGEDFSVIAFPAGSARLTDAELAKLAKIADTLRDRPDLKIEVKGYVDPDNDPEPYRREVLQDKVRREKLFDLRKELGDAAPTGADGVTVAAAEYSDYLWRVYKEGNFPKPRNLVGLVKRLPDTELEKLLLANTRVGSEELATLAQTRAGSVITALTQNGRIPHERLFLGTTEITAPPADPATPRSRAEFGMALK
jgi:uncharacterized protein involved in outer membrane biogenesis